MWVEFKCLTCSVLISAWLIICNFFKMLQLDSYWMRLKYNRWSCVLPAPAVYCGTWTDPNYPFIYHTFHIIPRHSDVIAMFFNNENKIWAEARLPSPVLLFNSLPPNLDAIFMTQWTKVLFEGPKRTVEPTPLDVFDIAMDAEI